MFISITESDAYVSIKVTGSIRPTDAESIKDPFEEILKGPQKDVMMDLSECPSMSSLGIGKLIFLNDNLKRQERSMEIVAIHRNLLGLFSSMKLTLVFNIRES